MKKIRNFSAYPKYTVVLHPLNCYKNKRRPIIHFTSLRSACIFVNGIIDTKDRRPWRAAQIIESDALETETILYCSINEEMINRIVAKYMGS